LGILSSLNREQKEAVGLLQIGTFLEYFDLMLYVHMAVLLNELFFPKTDPHTAALLTAFAFCSTYVLRPFGALLFGYIGDNIGRKPTVIMTTMMMSISCIVMANLPTYAQIGISAAWIVTGCRIFQGLSSMGEVMAAKVYISEIVKIPAQYPAVSLIVVANSFGSFAALGIASLVTINGFNWRLAFWIGAGIAVIGSVARSRLRETPEFIEQQIKARERREIKNNKHSNKPISFYGLKCNEKGLNKKTTFFYVLVQCGWPFAFYLAYMYFNPILKEKFGYSTEHIIFYNFLLSIIALLSDVILTRLSYTINPLNILKVKGFIFIGLMSLLPLIVTQATDAYQLFTFQALFLAFAIAPVPADSIFIKSIPIFSRVTTSSIIYASTRAGIYVITSFGLVYLTEAFGHYGLWLISLPISISFLLGVNHFIKLENLQTV
jgi:MFS family permease